MGISSQLRLGYLAVAVIIGVALSLSLNGVPLQAQPPGHYNTHPANWHDYHQNFTARCVPRADSQGRWGQQRQWDAWCKQNLRYRAAQPDQQWRQANPWDHGNASDRRNNNNGGEQK